MSGRRWIFIPPDEMLADMTAIYQQHLSKDDVDGMIAFYNSPAGQHLLDAQPVIAQEYMPLVMSKVSERSQAMTKEMMKEMAEIVPRQQAAASEAQSQRRSSAISLREGDSRNRKSRKARRNWYVVTG